MTAHDLMTFLKVKYIDQKPMGQWLPGPHSSLFEHTRIILSHVLFRRVWLVSDGDPNGSVWCSSRRAWDNYVSFFSQGLRSVRGVVGI